MKFTYNNTLFILTGCLLSDGLFTWLLRGNSTASDSGLHRLVVTFFILVGLLLYSKVARYFGAIWLGGLAFFTLLGIIHGIFASNAAIPINLRATIYIMVTLEIAAFYSLSLSKTFSLEFSEFRELAPEYINSSRKLIMGIGALFLLWQAIADINNLVEGRTAANYFF
jgi:hypothetical protein